MTTVLLALGSVEIFPRAPCTCTCEVDVNQVITKFLLMAPRSIIAPVSAISGPIQEDMEPQPDNDSDDEQYYADE